MLDHISIQVADPAKSAEFYTAALNALGVREAMRHERDGGLVIGLCGPDGFPHFWLGPVGGGECDVHSEREVHIAFSAADRQTVNDAHRAAVATGTEILHGPRVWPEYHPGYYAVFFRDLDGNNVEVVHHTFSAQTAP
ncbi:VOC family protein [Streptomyces sp. NPDC002133]|uniref:VOC family protein n=1 Tax=Streptomyces sp. NPDC002133 TaxID=3154409 RepID=UPI0033213093